MTGLLLLTDNRWMAAKLNALDTELDFVFEQEKHFLLRPSFAGAPGGRRFETIPEAPLEAMAALGELARQKDCDAIEAKMRDHISVPAPRPAWSPARLTVCCSN